LEAYGHQTTNDDGSAQVEIRRDLSGETYLLNAIGSINATCSSGQGIFPFATGRTFDYRVLNNVPGVYDVTYIIRLIGYIL
jgi:hypothetical protein